MTTHTAERSHPQTPAPTRHASPEPLVCGCGCGFLIGPGMSVRLIKGVAYVLGCVSEPVLVGDDGPTLDDLFGPPAGPFRR